MAFGLGFVDRGEYALVSEVHHVRKLGTMRKVYGMAVAWAPYYPHETDSE